MKRARAVWGNLNARANSAQRICLFIDRDLGTRPGKTQRRG